MRRLALVPTLIAALLLPSGAHALGLGEIEIQSALNQRLDAEIPLRGVPSGQGDEIEVALASEQAFENVGLDRPFALTRLQFTVKQRDGGGHYVHITSRESIVEPFLSFLVEIDWSGGNLLREYTVLLDPPVFTSEEDSDASGGGTTDTAETSEAGDGAGVTGEIEREAESADAEAESTRSASGSGQSGSAGGDDKPVFLEVEEREDRARAQADAERAAAADTGSASRSDGAPEQYGPVREGETLWSIASRLKSGDMTVQQMMIALLRYNPDAFGGRNINRLRQGYVLRVPEDDRVLEVSARRALAEVQEQNGVWQEMQEETRARTSVAASEQGAGDAGPSGERRTAADDGELSIVGADEGGASSDESASATGSTSEDESRELQLAREQLESTRLEKDELESRVQELEQTVSKMEKLLEVRDERLSALQEELRKLEGRQADDEEGATAEDETAGDVEAGTDVASADDAEEKPGADAETATDEESASTSGDDDETVAAADGDTGDSGEAGTTGTDGGSDDGETTVAEDGETTADDTASAGAGDDAGAQADEATASAGDEAGDYVPEDKRATEADRGFETTRTQEPEETWLDQVNGGIAAVTGTIAGLGGGLLRGPVGLGLGAAVVLLGGGLILMRRRREAAELDDQGDLESVDLDTDVAPFDADSSGRFDAQGPDFDEDDADRDSAKTEDAQSALMEEEFDVASLDEEESTERPASDALDEQARGIDDEEAEKDDTVAEADVYLAYGLHQQAEDLLRLAVQEQSGNAMYHEKLLETLYASGKTEEFIEEAETFRGMVDGPESRLWQRVLAMGRDLAPRHELFAEGDTEYTAADVQPARPAGTDLELDDAEGEIDFGLDEEPASSDSGDTGASDEQDDDEFSSTMMLDSGDFEAIDGDGGLVGPDDDGARQEDTTAPAATGAGAADEDEDEDLEFDLGDLEGLTEGEGAPAAASASDSDAADADEIDFDLDDDDTAASGDTTRTSGAAAADDDGALDFDLDFEAPDSPNEAVSGTEESDARGAETPASAESDDGALDFDFDLEETPATPSPDASSPAESDAAEPAGGADDEPLEIGDLEIGDLDSLETDSAPQADADEGESSPDSATAATAADDDGDADAFDLSDMESSLDEGPAAPATDGDTEAAAADDQGTADDDAFDLSDLDAMGGAGTDDGFDLDAAGATEPEDRETTDTGAAETASTVESPSAESVGAESAEDSGAAASESGEGDEDEFDTMLDLARAYIDMGDPESATNALEEVASAGNEKQRSEAQSLLDSVR